MRLCVRICGAGFASAHTVPGHHLCQPHCAARCVELRNGRACGTETTCRWVTTAVTTVEPDDPRGGSACVENKGENWIQWTVALSQWSYSAGAHATKPFEVFCSMPTLLLTSDCGETGIGLTILCPWLSMAFLTLVWAISFGTVFFMAQLTDGSFEFEGAGLLLVGAACVVRALDGETLGSLGRGSRPPMTTSPPQFVLVQKMMRDSGSVLWQGFWR